jgi:hypothetical protein
MKISKIILISVIAMTAFVSCKKDKADTQHPIEGRWVGTYVNDASGNSFYYSFNIKPGGIIEEINSAGQKIGEGSWELDNDIFSAHYKWSGGSEYSVIAAFYKSQGKLLGDWGYGDSATNGGTWQMQKK